jgi:hypothetical protein
MKRSTACVLAAAGSLTSLVIEGAMWGTAQVFSTLGVLLILVVPAFFVSPKHEPKDRIWLITILFKLASLLKRKGRGLLLGTSEPGEGMTESSGSPPLDKGPSGGGAEATHGLLLLGPGPAVPEDPPAGSKSRESIADLVR